MKKRILIVDSYALNSGDLAILMTLVENLEKRFPEASVEVESSHPYFLRNFDQFKTRNLYPRIFDIQSVGKGSGISRLKTILRGLYDSASFILAGVVFSIFRTLPYFFIRPSRRNSLKASFDADLILSTGGGFLSTHYNYGFRLLTYTVAFLLGKPVVHFAQSIGPFKTRLARILVPKYLKRAPLVIVREPDSFEYLKGIGIHENLHLYADIAFLLSSKDPGITIKKPAVAICLKKDNKSQRDAWYESVIVDFSKYLIEKNYEVILVAQTPVDDEQGLSIKNKLSEVVTFIPFGKDPRELKAVYNSCDFIVSSRMHAIIFAAAEGTPFIALSYEPKFIGLFSQLQYDNAYFFNDGKFDFEDLKKASEKLIIHRDAVSSQLKVHVSPIVKKSSDMYTLLETYC